MKKVTANVRKAMTENFEGMARMFGSQDEYLRGARVMLSYVLEARELHAIEKRIKIEKAVEERSGKTIYSFGTAKYLSEAFMEVEKDVETLIGRYWNFDWTLDGLADVIYETGALYRPNETSERNTLISKIWTDIKAIKMQIANSELEKVMA
jgi:hypothetical protein